MDFISRKFHELRPPSIMKAGCSERPKQWDYVQVCIRSCWIIQIPLFYLMHIKLPEYEVSLYLQMKPERYYLEKLNQ